MNPVIHSCQLSILMNSSPKSMTTAITILLILLGFVARLVPHPANVAPIAAIAIFGGLYLPARYSIILPLTGLFLSDLVIGLYSLPIMLAVYGGFAVTGGLALVARRRKSLGTVVGATLGGAVIFYLLTNGAVWAFGTMYPHTLSGLFESYRMAIPFFRNSLIGDFFYVSILVGAYEMVTLTVRRLRQQSAEEQA